MFFSRQGLNCKDHGASTLNLPIESGYWRASMDSVYIRECFNEVRCLTRPTFESSLSRSNKHSCLWTERVHPFSALLSALLLERDLLHGAIGWNLILYYGIFF